MGISALTILFLLTASPAFAADRGCAGAFAAVEGPPVPRRFSSITDKKEFHFQEKSVEPKIMIGEPRPGTAPHDLPARIYSVDWNTDNLIPIEVAQLPEETTQAKGILYYGRPALYDEYGKELPPEHLLSRFFQEGRFNKVPGTYDITAHIRGPENHVARTGLFSTSYDFDVAANFGYKTYDKTSAPGVVFVIHGKRTPGIDLQGFNKWLITNRPIGTDMGSPYKLETEFAITGIDPRQIEGAWVSRAAVPKAADGKKFVHPLELEFVRNPNYDPSWEYHPTGVSPPFVVPKPDRPEN